MYDESCENCPIAVMTKKDIESIWREIKESKEDRKILNEKVGVIEGNALKNDVTIEWIKTSITDIKTSIDRIATTLENLKSLPGTRWNKLVDVAIAAIVGGIIGIGITKLF